MKIINILCFFLLMIGCNKIKKESNKDNSNLVEKISSSSIKIRDKMKNNIVIAHRGSTYWTPEETEPAYRWARNIGADYLEFDIQLTKDNALVAFHNDDLIETTNIAKIFPDKLKSKINNFTLKELRQLDAGSWFNDKHPTRAKKYYKNLKILTLEDIVNIAEGNRIKRENGSPVKEIINGEWTGQYLYEKDPNDNGNRPGIYVETKSPKKGVEKILAKKITKLGWNINSQPKSIKTQQGKVDIANSDARLVLQSFSLNSIKLLDKHFPNIPKCLLIWYPDMKGDFKNNYIKAINFAVKNNVQSIGSSISGEPNNYDELTNLWMTELIHQSGLVIHPYTFDTTKQLTTYKGRIEGVFTNRADLALDIYNRSSKKSPEDILLELGYK